MSAGFAGLPRWVRGFAAWVQHPGVMPCGTCLYGLCCWMCLRWSRPRPVSAAAAGLLLLLLTFMLGAGSAARCAHTPCTLLASCSAADNPLVGRIDALCTPHLAAVHPVFQHSLSTAPNLMLPRRQPAGGPPRRHLHPPPGRLHPGGPGGSGLRDCRGRHLRPQGACCVHSQWVNAPGGLQRLA